MLVASWVALGPLNYAAKQAIAQLASGTQAAISRLCFERSCSTGRFSLLQHELLQEGDLFTRFSGDKRQVAQFLQVTLPWQIVSPLSMLVSSLAILFSTDWR